jgi:hypothetical protein
MKSVKRKSEPIPIPIVETGSNIESEPSFLNKRKSKRVIYSMPVFKSETTEETETDVTDASPVHSKYIHSVISRKLSQDPIFGMYQDVIDVSFKIWRSTFKYKHIFVDGKKYKETQG